MKIFTIGDSVSQGFMSGAAARTDLSYSSLLARALGLFPGSRSSGKTDYFYPEWKKGGLPINLEAIVRRVCQRYGHDISGLEWVTVLQTVNQVLNESEKYYERGEGSADRRYPGKVPFFHNVSSWAFQVADTWLVTPETCIKEIIAQAYKSQDNWFSCANAAFYRTALKVLSPNLDCNFSQLDWLSLHAGREGVENLVLWLGINNALGTLVTLRMRQTPNEPGRRPHTLSHEERCRNGWNLWHPEDFKAEYTELLDRVDRIMSERNRCRDWRVFIGNIPHITTAPLLKGFGPVIQGGDGNIYFPHYTFMLLDENFALQDGTYLSYENARHVNDYIDEYNRIIKRLAEERNGIHLSQGEEGPYHLVDIGGAFKQIILSCLGYGDYTWPGHFPAIDPPVNSRYYHTDTEGRFCQGGIFSLDGVHPSAIGQGLIASEFFKVMQAAGRVFQQPLDWLSILKSDTLYQRPIGIMHELYRHQNLSALLIKKLQTLVFQHFRPHH